MEYTRIALDSLWKVDLEVLLQHGSPSLMNLYPVEVRGDIHPGTSLE
jgi:hypothetical protein